MFLEAIQKDFDDFALNLYNAATYEKATKQYDPFLSIFFTNETRVAAYREQYTFDMFKREAAAELRQAYAEARIAETRNLINLALGLIRK